MTPFRHSFFFLLKKSSEKFIRCTCKCICCLMSIIQKNNYNLLIVLDKMTKLISFDKVRDLINNKMKFSELI